MPNFVNHKAAIVWAKAWLTFLQSDLQKEVSAKITFLGSESQGEVSAASPAPTGEKFLLLSRADRRQQIGRVRSILRYHEHNLDKLPQELRQLLLEPGEKRHHLTFTGREGRDHSGNRTIIVICDCGTELGIRVSFFGKQKGCVLCKGRGTRPKVPYPKRKRVSAFTPEELVLARAQRQAHTRARRMTNRAYYVWEIARKRAAVKRGEVPFTIRWQDIEVPEVCPVTRLPFRGDELLVLYCPERGYIPGNVGVVSREGTRILEGMRVEPEDQREPVGFLGEYASDETLLSVWVDDEAEDLGFSIVGVRDQERKSA